MRDKPKTYHLADMYKAYALSLLAANPDWTAVIDKHKKVPMGTITRPYDKFDKKLRHKRTVVMTYQMYAKVVKTYFNLAKEATIQGEVVNLGNRLGKVTVIRAQRNFKKKTVDFHKTSLQPKVWNEEKGRMVASKVVYHMDEDWSWPKWFKTRTVKNDSVYEFVPTLNCKVGASGYNQMLRRALKENPLLKYKYIYYPLINFKTACSTNPVQ